jgi:hypothetical protein
MRVLVVAPVMTNLNASGGGRDEYWKLPKGNLDITGQYFVWTSNAGGNRLDAFVVKVPAHLLVEPRGPVVDAATPTVAVTAPAAPARLTGTVTVSASASDPVGVAGVQFRLNGANLGPEITAAPYTLAWDTTEAPNGLHALTAVARLGSGGTAASPVVAVKVANGAASRRKAVVWTKRVNVTATGSALRKSGGCQGCPDAGAVSVQKLSRDGAFEFIASETDTLRYVGLSAGGRPAAGHDLAFAIAFQPGGHAEVREGGAYKADTPFAAGDVFALAVEDGTVVYSKNGEAFYQSAQAPSLPLRAGAVLMTRGSTIGGALLKHGD